MEDVPGTYLSSDTWIPRRVESYTASEHTSVMLGYQRQPHSFIAAVAFKLVSELIWTISLKSNPSG